MPTSPPAPKWLLDLSAPPAAGKKSSGILDPPGYPTQVSTTSSKQKQGPKPTQGTNRKQQPAASSTTSTTTTITPNTPSPLEMDNLKVKKAWEVALAPVKALPMTAIMMYMSGNSLQIFSIMMVFMAFKNPVLGIAATGQALDRFGTDTNRARIRLVKLAYVAFQLLALALGVWKVNAMGLLPTTRSDWLAWEAQRDPLERAAHAL